MARAAAALLLAALFFGLTAGSAGAAFPGRSGRIAFTDFVPSSPGDDNAPDHGTRTGSVRPDGSGRQLFPCAGDSRPCGDRDAAFSRDGARIAFTAGGSSHPSIAVMRSDGSDLHLLPVEGENPTWSPSGARIAFERRGDIWIASANGEGLERVTFRGGSQPAWSSDGRIAFTRLTRDTGFPGLDTDVFVIRPGAARARRLTFKSGSSPDWSPHASKIAFERRLDVYVVRSRGGGLRRFTFGEAGSPVWSPGGRRIAFLHPVFADDGNQGIYVKRTDGRGLRRVLNSALPSSWQPLR
jgi:Tol biopolymer transport system component